MFELLMSNNSKKEINYDGPFLGEVLPEDFISNTELSTQCNINTGILINPDESWLKFYYEGKVLYVAKKQFRTHCNYSLLDSLGLRFGSKIITIKGDSYKVRFLKGLTGTQVNRGSYPGNEPWTSKSEWNNLFYPLIKDLPVTGYPKWAEYEFEELSTPGTYPAVCQESESSGLLVMRGHATGTLLQRVTQQNGTSYANGRSVVYSWRPVLELVQ